MRKAKKKKPKVNHLRFVFWRRSPTELSREFGAFPVIDTLEHKIKEAKEIVAEGKYDTVIVLEIVKVITCGKLPPKVADYEGRQGGL